MRAFWMLLIVVPMATGTVTTQQNVEVALGVQAPLATLRGGDAGTTTLGPGATSATIRVSDSSILVADDVLDIVTANDGWRVSAQYVSHTGFTGLTTTFTLSLRDGLVSSQQITIINGAATRTLGSPVDLPTAQDTQLFAVASLLAAGTVTLEIVIAPDSGTGLVLLYPVVVTVT